jgi:F-type H+/Na+-transporting ATPase subunit alpha
LRLDLAQYRELEAFAAFGSDLDAASKSQLERGARMVELLKQGQYSPYSVERMAASIWAGTTGNMDSIPVADIRRFESEFLDFIGRERPKVFEVIAATKELTDDTVASLQEAIDTFKKQFSSSVTAAVNEAEAAALAGEDNEQITRQVPKVRK